MQPLQTLLKRLETDRSLESPDRLPCRLDALDRIEAYLPHVDDADKDLLRRAQVVFEQYEDLNASVYHGLREDIRSGRGAGRLMEWVAASDRHATGGRGSQGYDLLDEVVGGVLQIGEPRVPTVELTADMVFYQPTPARHIFETIRRSGVDEGDVLIDLGSGLGHVPLLVAACTRAHAIGIELEPAYVACAQQAGAALNLPNVSFVQGDARTADLSTGTVFYLYTPFKGAMLREVLDRLRKEAAQRAIRLCTFGPCTPVVAGEPWLSQFDPWEVDGLAVFHSAAL